MGILNNEDILNFLKFQKTIYKFGEKKHENPDKLHYYIPIDVISDNKLFVMITSKIQKKKDR